MPKTSRKRHLAKTVTWRCVGTIDTIILSWVISGDPMIGLQVGFAEVLTKMLLYYGHERFWFKINVPEGSNWRHILKTISWRIIGTVDTMILAWVISGDPLTGLKIGLAELITKMLLYYVHEKVWYKSNYGLSGIRDTVKTKADEL